MRVRKHQKAREGSGRVAVIVFGRENLVADLERRLHRAGGHVERLGDRSFRRDHHQNDAQNVDEALAPAVRAGGGIAVFGRRHQAVPPTVILSMRNEGWPTPTGTPCPFLPQVPIPGSSAKSLPIMVMRLRSVGPLPISIAPFTGAPTLPFSILYASVHWKTYLPDVMSTWPPPKLTA